MKTLLALSLFAPLAHAQPVAALVPAQSEIVFTSTQMGVPVEGRFRRFDAAIALDPKRPEAGRVAITLDAASATLGIAETDAELLKPNWFDTARFAQASFRSTSIKGLGAGRYEVVGTLTIKGSAQPLVVPVQLTQSAGSSVASGSFTIKRLAFRIGDAEWADTSLVADNVLVRFKLTLTGLAPL
ncbi:MAG: YceI family protein [Pseudomonadota bacterium]